MGFAFVIYGMLLSGAAGMNLLAEAFGGLNWIRCNT